MSLLKNIISNIKKDQFGKRLVKWSGIVLTSLAIIASIFALLSSINFSYKIIQITILFVVSIIIFALINSFTIIRNAIVTTINYFTKKKVNKNIVLAITILLAAAISYFTYLIAIIGFVGFAFARPF